eukprot:3446293-Lingulodinium_polyedra.AAC.1
MVTTEIITLSLIVPTDWPPSSPYSPLFLETLRLEKELLQAEDEGRIFDAVDRKRTATQHTITP